MLSREGHATLYREGRILKIFYKNLNNVEKVYKKIIKHNVPKTYAAVHHWTLELIDIEESYAIKKH